MTAGYFGYNKRGQEVMKMCELVLLCKIIVIAVACVGAVWCGYWYKEHVM